MDSEKYNDDRYVSSKSTSHGYGTSVWVPENNDSKPSVIIDLGTDMDVADFKVFGGVLQDKNEPEKKYRQVYSYPSKIEYNLYTEKEKNTFSDNTTLIGGGRKKIGDFGEVAEIDSEPYPEIHEKNLAVPNCSKSINGEWSNTLPNSEKRYPLINKNIFKISDTSVTISKINLDRNGEDIRWKSYDIGDNEIPETCVKKESTNSVNDGMIENTTRNEGNPACGRVKSGT